MKRFILLLGAFLLFTGIFLYAETQVLIDFSKLAADTKLGNNKEATENGQTLIDFSAVAGASFSAEEKAKMKTSLALDNWGVVLASSSRTIQNQALSMTREATTSAKAKPFNGEEMANKKVLGIRVHFPVAPYNSWAIVKPPFDIPAYADKTELQGDKLVVPDAEKGRGNKFNGYGVVKNVGILKSLSVTVYGSNFPNGFGVILENQNHEQQQIFIDYLNFDGWRTLTWNNPNYVSEVRNREIKKYPLYPKSAPFVKLAGLVIYRDASQEGGDFITYVKDIKVTYDKAVLDLQRDIDDEAIWGILKARQEARRAAELKRLGNIQVLRYLEKQKMDKGIEK